MDWQTPTLAGLDHTAHAILHARWQPIRTFLEQHLAITTVENTDRSVLKARFLELEACISHSRSDDWAERTNGRQHWQTHYLLPLAHALDHVREHEIRCLIAQWRTGMIAGPLRQPRPATQKPPMMQIHRVRGILHQPLSQAKRITLLIQQNLCHNEESAQSVLRAVDTARAYALGDARGMILSVLGQGVLGLLRNSDYPWVEELVLVERYHAVLKDAGPSEHMLATVRRDVIALATVCSRPEFAVWNINVLHDPPATQRRNRLQKTLYGTFRQNVIHALTDARGCDIIEATHLLEYVISGGLPAIIDWRCGTSGSVGGDVRSRQIQNVLQTHFGALTASTQATMLTTLYQIQDAISETGIAFPLLRLLDEYPSSRYRLALGRRFWFGTPSIQRRRQRHRRKIHRPRWRIKTGPPFPDDVVKRFVEAVAHRLGLTPEATRDRLRQLITYGGLGVVPKKDWATALDSRLVDYIHLITMGHVRGSVDLNALQIQVNQYATMLGYPAVSRQLLNTLFFSLPKPRRWNGGTGEATARTRQRATLTVTKVPLLHECWSILSFAWQLPLINEAHHHYSDTAYVVLVMDMAAHIPMGCWVSPTPPTSETVGLAVYQAVWHPFRKPWPIYGIPNTLEIETALADDLTPIHASAAWLLCTVKTVDHVARRPIAWLADLERHGATMIRQRFETPTAQQVQQYLLDWLRTTCYPNHRSAQVPATLRKQGVVHPAWNSPAAGWLLPSCGTTTITNGQCVVQHQSYTADGLERYEGCACSVRGLSAPYAHTRHGLFVQPLSHEGVLLHVVAMR